MRRALRRRDGGCRYPGCTNRRFVDGHHIVHWSQGGPTSLENLVLLCRRHHRLVHEGGAHVVPAGAGTFDFFRRGGRPIPASPPLRRAAKLRLVSGSPESIGQGEPYDLGLTIDALLGRIRAEELRLGQYGRSCLGSAVAAGTAGAVGQAA
jgi:hypothetical protein